MVRIEVVRMYSTKEIAEELGLPHDHVRLSARKGIIEEVSYYPITKSLGKLYGYVERRYYKHIELPMKFYNLPIDPPEDRHKWFYGVHEAERFMRERGNRNGMEVVQLDREHASLNLKRRLFRIVLKLIVHKDVHVDSLWSGHVLAVLVKRKNTV